VEASQGLEGEEEMVPVQEVLVEGAGLEMGNLQIGIRSRGPRLEGVQTGSKFEYLYICIYIHIIYIYICVYIYIYIYGWVYLCM